VIILHGKPYQHLPSKLQEKVDAVEKQMIKICGGTYHCKTRVYLRLIVSLQRGGVWIFEERCAGMQLSQLKIKPNVINDLGNLGGLLFLPGREVTITGVSKFHLEKRTMSMTFHGFCSWHPNNQGTHDIIIEMTFERDLDTLHVETTRVDANGIKIQYDDSIPMEDHPILCRLYQKKSYSDYEESQEENSDDEMLEDI